MTKVFLFFFVILGLCIYRSLLKEPWFNARSSIVPPRGIFRTIFKVVLLAAGIQNSEHVPVTVSVSQLMNPSDGKAPDVNLHGCKFHSFKTAFSTEQNPTEQSHIKPMAGRSKPEGQFVKMERKSNSWFLHPIFTFSSVE